MNFSKSELEPAQWVSRYGDYLYSLAVLKVNDTATAEDLVQETFMAAIKAKGTYRGDSSEKTWLVSILNNKVIDYYRKKDVLKNATTYLSETEESFTENFFSRQNGHWLKTAAPRDWTIYADDSLNQMEFQKVIQFCIQKMPPRLIPVFIARFLDQEESELICKVLGISPSNYWVMIHRAKILMRSCLEKNWFFK
jgi:RNA polymerase sigma-70 factor (TIGR02943 family)